MEIAELKQKDLEIYVTGDTIIIKGEINQENPEHFLTPFFTKVIGQMAGDIILDLKELEFLNSSGIKPLIQFLMKRNKQWRVKIKTNPFSSWQRTSLKILTGLDDNIVLE
ncbi:MAG: hypothetical protein JXJ04_18570 [Spirochaetales bacterium]|nr:hypothetical protein [Spirochaetales bacterium]